MKRVATLRESKIRLSKLKAEEVLMKLGVEDKSEKFEFKGSY
jgi:hypothetical protein